MPSGPGPAHPTGPSTLTPCSSSALMVSTTRWLRPSSTPQRRVWSAFSTTPQVCAPAPSWHLPVPMWACPLTCLRAHTWAGLTDAFWLSTRGLAAGLAVLGPAAGSQCLGAQPGSLGCLVLSLEAVLSFVQMRSPPRMGFPPGRCPQGSLGQKTAWGGALWRWSLVQSRVPNDRQAQAGRRPASSSAVSVTWG